MVIGEQHKSWRGVLKKTEGKADQINVLDSYALSTTARCVRTTKYDS